MESALKQAALISWFYKCRLQVWFCPYYELIPNTPKFTESNTSMNWSTENNIKPALSHFMPLPVFTKAGHKFDFVHYASGSWQNEEKFIE